MVSHLPLRFIFANKGKQIAALLLAIAGFALCFISPACAEPAGTCTWDAPFQVNQHMAIVTDVVNRVSCLLFGSGSLGGCVSRDQTIAYPTNNVTEMLFVAITNHGAFTNILQAAIALYIVFYGIAFTLGMINLTFMDFTVRMVKVSVILALVSPASWGFFNNNVVYFFKDGGDWLVNTMSGMPGGAFFTIDTAINNTLSARMLVTLVAALFSGPYGLILGLILLMSLGTFISSILQATWIYLMSLVIKAFLLGLAPIFFVFLLFSKTRHLFDGWLNQLISATLQPVFLFMFFGFFAQMVLNAMSYILSFDVCYMPTQGLFRGTPHDLVMPRFTRDGRPYGGVISWGDDFPLPVFDILVFLLLTQLTWRFNSIVMQLAKEISGASTSLSMAGALSSAMNPGSMLTNRVTKAAGTAAQNLAASNSSKVKSTVQTVARNTVPGAGGGNRPGGIQ